MKRRRPALGQRDDGHSSGEVILIRADARTSDTAASIQAPFPPLRAGCCPADCSPQALGMRLVRTGERKPQAGLPGNRQLCHKPTRHGFIIHFPHLRKAASTRPHAAKQRFTIRSTPRHRRSVNVASTPSPGPRIPPELGSPPRAPKDWALESPSRPQHAFQLDHKSVPNDLWSRTPAGLITSHETRRPIVEDAGGWRPPSWYRRS
jgi:hypothetical protein